jgi:Zn-dependent M28 family amino/carboxypeptidase
MKKILFLFSILLLVACKSKNSGNGESTSTETATSAAVISATDYEKYIVADELKKHLYIIASDEMEGRKTGEKGQKMAAEYIKNFYIENGVAPAIADEEYFQHIPKSYFNSERTKGLEASENILGFVEGSEFPEEIIVISAHYDHIGMDKDGNVFNGADDDGSGTVAVMELARIFTKAKNEGNGPKRSILFLHVTAEEVGLVGSRYYSENPVFPLENTVANLNIDMIGRIDPNKSDNPEYIYLIGSDKLSQELHQVSEDVNRMYVNLELDYTFNDENDPNRFYYRSDHYNFAKHGIPVIFYFNGVHEDYHKIGDTPDKIEYDLMEKRAKLVFHTAWELANRKDRIKVDITE